MLEQPTTSQMQLLNLLLNFVLVLGLLESFYLRVDVHLFHSDFFALFDGELLGVESFGQLGAHALRVRVLTWKVLPWVVLCICSAIDQWSMSSLSLRVFQS